MKYLETNQVGSSFWPCFCIFHGPSRFYLHMPNFRVGTSSSQIFHDRHTLFMPSNNKAATSYGCLIILLWLVDQPHLYWLNPGWNRSNAAAKSFRTPYIGHCNSSFLNHNKLSFRGSPPTRLKFLIWALSFIIIVRGRISLRKHQLTVPKKWKFFFVISPTTLKLYKEKRMRITSTSQDLERYSWTHMVHTRPQNS